MNIMVIPDYFGILSVGGFSNVLLFDCFVVLCLAAHFNCMTTDPGAVPSNARPLPGLLERTDTIPLCKHTGCFKPPRSHYDRVTQRCVVKMDHFCPWYVISLTTTTTTTTTTTHRFNFVQGEQHSWYSKS